MKIKSKSTILWYLPTQRKCCYISQVSTMIESGLLNCKLEDLDMLDGAMFCLCQTGSVKLHKYPSETEQPGEWALLQGTLKDPSGSANFSEAMIGIKFTISKYWFLARLDSEPNLHKIHTIQPLRPPNGITIKLQHFSVSHIWFTLCGCSWMWNIISGSS